MEYSYNSLDHENGDWIVDKILEAGGAITMDSYSGKLLEGKPEGRLVRLEFDALVVEFECSGKECAMVIFANDGNKQILMQSSRAMLTNKEMAMAILIDYNETVSAALEAATQARMRQMMSMQPKPTVKPRGKK